MPSHGDDGSASDERPVPASAAYDGEAFTPVTVYGSGGGSRWSPKRVRLAVITGLLAFGIVVAVFTLPELVAGKSIGGGGAQRTTLFGGTATKQKSTSEPKDKTTATPTATPEAGTTPTATPQATTTPAATPTTTATPAPS